MDKDLTKDKEIEELIVAAVIDSINRFANEVLIEKGVLEKNVWLGDTLDEGKYRIAGEIAEQYKQYITELE